MKKLSLILAALLVVGCFAFAACNKTEEPAESSAATSAESNADTSAATSTETSTEASAETSAEASAETSTEASAETSTEASAETSTDIDVSGVDGEAGTNVALNKTYTGAEPSAAGGYTASLTDGAASAEPLFDNSWFAYYHNMDATDKSLINIEDGMGIIVIDLGESYSNIAKVRVHVWPSNAAGLVAPDKITAYGSNDGSSFAELGEVALPESADPAWAELSLSDVATARYIKVAIDIADMGGVWTFLNEIEVILG